ncbi:hypothetical protein MJO29_008167 [Puccinia striiformis f. sp. tritici]|nr:hypothetical protein MJO29_008167 [Puccinia striiformis f. sp. tritici]
MMIRRLGSGLGHRPLVVRPRLTILRPARYSTLQNDGRQILASIEGGLKSGPAEPMPEDAKGQAVSALRRIGLVMRLAFYAGLGVGVTGTIGFVGLHLWIEYLELSPPKSTAQNHQSIIKYGWEDEIEGWGGKHLGKGTDPQLGWRIRALIRSAWVAQNWQTGQLAIESSDQSYQGGPLVDSAYALSESRLQQAISMAQASGRKLEKDPTLFELQLRLADICQRINTPISLIKSHEIYTQLWKSCINSFVRFDTDDERSRDWEIRQAIRIADNLGQVGLKIAALQRPVDPSRANDYQQVAEKYLIWAINKGLGIESSPEHSVGLQSTVQSKGSSVWPTFFGRSDQQLGNSHDSSPPKNNTLYTQLGPIAERLELLASHPTQSDPAFTPAQLRLTVSSLMNLSVHLVSVDIQKAFTLQNLIREFVNMAIKTQGEDRMNQSSTDAKLHYHWLWSRAALSSVYISEIGQATHQSDDQTIVDRCQNALRIVDSTLSNLEQESSGTSSGVFQPGFTRSSSGRLSEQIENLKRDLRLTGTMGSNFLGLKYETCPPKTFLEQASNRQQKSNFKWCYSDANGDDRNQAESGCQLAKLFFQRAVDYSLGTSHDSHHSGNFLKHHQPLVLINPLNENLQHLSRIESQSKNS